MITIIPFDRVLKLLISFEVIKERESVKSINRYGTLEERLCKNRRIFRDAC